MVQRSSGYASPGRPTERDDFHEGRPVQGPPGGCGFGGARASRPGSRPTLLPLTGYRQMPSMMPVLSCCERPARTQAWHVALAPLRGLPPLAFSGGEQCAHPAGFAIWKYPDSASSGRDPVSITGSITLSGGDTVIGDPSLAHRVLLSTLAGSPRHRQGLATTREARVDGGGE
jgi:hypothetical protein